jgi:cation transport ATPase
MKHGADIAHESAAVVLMDDSLWKLVQAIELSRGAVRLIKQNYGIVAVMNTVALGLALPGGLIGSAAIAVISNGSAILASLNGIRPLLRRKSEHPGVSLTRLSWSGVARTPEEQVQSNRVAMHRIMN